MDQLPLTEAHIKALEARALDVETVVRLGVGASDKRGGDWVAIPFYDNGEVVGRKHRGWGREKGFLQDVGSRQILYNIDCLRDAGLAGEPLIVTEGEMDCISAIQSGFLRSVSVPGGAPNEKVKDGEKKYAFLEEHRQLLDGVKEIILATDDDGPGQNLRADLALRLGAARCKFIQYPKGCKDLNDALMAYGVKGVQAAIARARPMPIAGYYEIDELPELGPNPAFDTGIVNLSEHYKLRLGDFTVITGGPGSGKSTLINEICGRMASTYKWKSIFFSPEQVPQTDHRRALRTFFAEKAESMLDEKEKIAADAWIKQYFGFIVPDEDRPPTLTWFLETAAQAVLRKEAQVVVLDPLNELEDDSPPGLSQTDYIGFCIKQFKRFARKYHVHFILCAHPKQMQRNREGKFPIPSMYDISGSAHFANKADVGIIVHREDMAKNETLIRVAKVRYHSIGHPGELHGVFDLHRSRFTIREDVD